ncbi:hypothetical protein DID77_00420 [Candidatus Marinamargulisbacteria bacterium SCGC AG-439-L15]|nr:hypothetical protein DID77_00420 [Candidatus Marinamargulisbacteria bacterium SCGC AG-439-L15]
MTSLCFSSCFGCFLFSGHESRGASSSLEEVKSCSAKFSQETFIDEIRAIDISAGVGNLARYPNLRAFFGNDPSPSILSDAIRVIRSSISTFLTDKKIQFVCKSRHENKTLCSVLPVRMQVCGEERTVLLRLQSDKHFVERVEKSIGGSRVARIVSYEIGDDEYYFVGLKSSVTNALKVLDKQRVLKTRDIGNSGLFHFDDSFDDLGVGVIIYYSETKGATKRKGLCALMISDPKLELSPSLLCSAPGNRLDIGLLSQMGSAITALHSRAIAHGDIKYENFLYDEDQKKVFCSDFESITSSGELFVKGFRHTFKFLRKMGTLADCYSYDWFCFALILIELYDEQPAVFELAKKNDPNYLLLQLDVLLACFSNRESFAEKRVSFTDEQTHLYLTKLICAGLLLSHPNLKTAFSRYSSGLGLQPSKEADIATIVNILNEYCQNLIQGLLISKQKNGDLSRIRSTYL